ncbi:MAG TPA: alpha/beta hydrolase [candidate division Zixibacteria bacterium]|nr:alpha/beta hydrolase [candidate division Zixibacteria bacterium]HER00222.1 alpha/beta hydrolase [candidate division Zixibacteria bacterium]
MTGERQDFIQTQQRMLDRYRIKAQSQLIEIPSIGGHAQVLVSGEGPPVVVINGIGTPGAMWAPLMAELEGFQLYAVDLPGYGLTDTHPDFASDMRRNAVLFLEEVLGSLGLDRPAFMANSLGSLWSYWLALDRDRVGPMIHIGCPALVLNSSAPFPMRILSVRPLGRLMTRLQPPSEKQVRQLSKMVKEYPLVPELIDLLVATERLPAFRQMFLSTVHTLLRLRGTRPEKRLTANQLTKIHQPTLIFWGENDPFGSPDIGQAMVESMPDAELHIVGGGHAPWLTQAKRISPIAGEFLRRHS